MLSDILSRHRGPYRFLLTTRDAAGVLHSLAYPLDVEEMIASGDVHLQAADVLETDPDVVSIGVWSVADEQFVGVVRRGDRLF